MFMTLISTANALDLIATTVVVMFFGGFFWTLGARLASR